MQTFLPYKSFQKSAQVLDQKRLGKQRVEVLQILKALNKETLGWRNHPITLMWEGYENALVEYGVAICDEWISRGYRDTCRDKILQYRNKRKVKYPNFLGKRKFHRYYQLLLLDKKPEYYEQYFKP